jgi:ribose transport system permease protein
MSSVFTMRSNLKSQEAIVAVLNVVLFACFSIFVPGFLSGGNLMGVLQSVATLGLLALGMSMVVIAGGIDLSMIAVVVVPAALILNLVTNGTSLGNAFLVGLAFALGVGLLNAWLIAYVRLPPLFVTLSTGLALYGTAYGVFGLDVVTWPSQLSNLSWVGRASLLGVPLPVVVLIVMALAIAVFLNFTRVGRFIYAMGDNPAGASAVGIPIRRMIVLIYVLSALIAFVTGVIMATVLNAGAIRTYNSTLIYDVILVIVLGGVGLSGGRGGVLSVVLGTILIGTLTNAMTLMNTDYPEQNLIKGFLLLGAVIVDSKLNPRNEETAQQGDI